MKSFYAIRLYELLKSDFYKETTEYIEYMVQDLRQFFECENKYKLFADFRKRVIDTAIVEINNKSDIEIREIEYIKRGRKTDRVRFWVGYNFLVNKQRELSK